MEEIWKDVPDYEGLYKVSNWGNVKSLFRYVHVRNKAYRPIKERILRPSVVKDGYLEVILCPNPKVRKHFRVHRLVALAFLKNTNNYPEIDHIDGNPKNNRVENLRWVTRKQNGLNPITRQNISLSKLGDKNPNYGKRKN